MGSFAAFCKKKADAMFFCISFLHNNIPFRPYGLRGCNPVRRRGYFQQYISIGYVKY